MRKSLSLFLLTGLIVGSAVAMATEVMTNKLLHEKSVDIFIELLATQQYERSNYRRYGILDKQYYIDLVTPSAMRIVGLPASSALLNRPEEERLFFRAIALLYKSISSVYTSVNAYPITSLEKYEQIMEHAVQTLSVIIKKYCGQTVDAARQARLIMVILRDLSSIDDFNDEAANILYYALQQEELDLLNKNL